MRIEECKAMIQALHNAGISVVMDVVYNHTYSNSKDDSCFQATVPDYYYRLTKSGTFSNGSGCGNEVSTERAMTRKYVIDSILHWTNEYHIDGFRFDLMGVHDIRGSPFGARAGQAAPPPILPPPAPAPSTIRASRRTRSS